MNAYRWPQVNVWYCGHCNTDLGTKAQPSACQTCNAKHSFMIQKTEYLDIGAPNAKNDNRGREETAPKALLEGGEQRPNPTPILREGPENLQGPDGTYRNGETGGA